MEVLWGAEPEVIRWPVTRSVLLSTIDRGAREKRNHCHRGLSEVQYTNACRSALVSERRRTRGTPFPRASTDDSRIPSNLGTTGRLSSRGTVAIPSVRHPVRRRAVADLRAERVDEMRGSLFQPLKQGDVAVSSTHRMLAILAALVHSTDPSATSLDSGLPFTVPNGSAALNAIIRLQDITKE